MKKFKTLNFRTAAGHRAHAEVNPDAGAIDSFITSLPDIFDTEGTEIFRSRNTVREIITDGHSYIVKRYRRPSIINRVIYTLLRPSKACRAFRYAFRFNSAGITTPEALACVEVRTNGLLSDSYFVSEKCDGQQAFEALVKTPDYDRHLAEAVAHFILRMHRAGIIHGDPNLKNFLYDTAADGNYQLQVIDINRSAFADTLTRRQIVHNLSRVTHRRDLLAVITGIYAAEAGLGQQQLIDDVVRSVKRIERNRERRHAIKRLFTSSKSLFNNKC